MMFPEVQSCYSYSNTNQQPPTTEEPHQSIYFICNLLSNSHFFEHFLIDIDC